MNLDTLDSVAFAKVLADPTRQQIMDVCCCRWCSVNQIVESLGGQVSQPTISHHLAVLREAGLVQVRREGKQVFYTLNQERVAFCCGQIMLKLAPEAAATQQITELEAG